MKKPLILFLVSLLLLLIAGMAYTKYCKSKPNGCKKMQRDTEDSYPTKGVDW